LIAHLRKIMKNQPGIRTTHSVDLRARGRGIGWVLSMLMISILEIITTTTTKTKTTSLIHMNCMVLINLKIKVRETCLISNLNLLLNSQKLCWINLMMNQTGSLITNDIVLIINKSRKLYHHRNRKTWPWE